MAHNYYIPLNKPILLFFPHPNLHSEHTSTTGDSAGHVIMVTVKGAFQNNVSAEIPTFYLSQYEITKVIENLVYAHIFTSLPPKVEVQGKGYALTGTRKTWEYGKTLQLAWGANELETGLEKWTFVFKVVPERLHPAEQIMDSEPIQQPIVST
ncbi:hypothetical protein HYPSUDRAFT_199756 [Hypholoma sublateritium FD-334 SS-4]|uniref:Uncharacterized protein n=1 Tax=Hypholoma sublateritium (strain FD-334 SS-4) TaxID=945553 RepID=A0A0D2PAN9_HYPSF|nr:hypothetical protein HYPSUDRAFT_199756 [Hypholoma sublateritium FD-334 SS-4]